jgi:hypothetical protein
VFLHDVLHETLMQAKSSRRVRCVQFWVTETMLNPNIAPLAAQPEAFLPLL